MSPVLVAIIALVALAVLAFLLSRRYLPARSRYERMLATLTGNERNALLQLEASADRNWGKKQQEAFDAIGSKLKRLGYTASQLDNEIVYTDERRSGSTEFGRGFERPKAVR